MIYKNQLQNFRKQLQNTAAQKQRKYVLNAKICQKLSNNVLHFKIYCLSKIKPWNAWPFDPWNSTSKVQFSVVLLNINASLTGIIKVTLLSSTILLVFKWGANRCSGRLNDKIRRKKNQLERWTPSTYHIGIHSQWISEKDEPQKRSTWPWTNTQ